MKKEDVLALLEKYKDHVIEVGVADEGITLYGGIKNHWLFVEGDNLVEIKTNVSSPTYGVGTVNPAESPFVRLSVSFDYISCVKCYAKREDIYAITDGLEVVGTSASLDDIKKAIETNSVLNVRSPRGYSDAEPTIGGSYGKKEEVRIRVRKDGIVEH